MEKRPHRDGSNQSLHAGVLQVFPNARASSNTSLPSKDAKRIRSAVEAGNNPDSVIITRIDARQAKHYGGEHADCGASGQGVKRLKAAL